MLKLVLFFTFKAVKPNLLQIVQIAVITSEIKRAAIVGQFVSN